MDTLNDLERSGAAWRAAQKSVLGALLLWSDDLAGKIFRSAKSVYFEDAALRHLFEAAQGLWLERRPIDPVTVLKAAGDQYGDLIQNALNDINGKAYRFELRSGYLPPPQAEPEKAKESASPTGWKTEKSFIKDNGKTEIINHKNKSGQHKKC